MHNEHRVAFPPVQSPQTWVSGPTTLTMAKGEERLHAKWPTFQQNVHTFTDSTTNQIVTVWNPSNK